MHLLALVLCTYFHGSLLQEKQTLSLTSFSISPRRLLKEPIAQLDREHGTQTRVSIRLLSP